MLHNNIQRKKEKKEKEKAYKCFPFCYLQQNRKFYTTNNDRLYKR